MAPATCAAPLKPRPWRKARDQNQERRDHAAKDDAHLPFLREIHRLAAAGDGVNDHEQAGADDGQVQPPAQHGRKDDGRRINRDAGGEAALQQKQARAEQPGFGVETLAEKFVGRVNSKPAVNRQENGAYDDQRERQAKIILDEADSAFKTLARGGKKRDRARLGGHHRNADGAPARGLAAFEIGVEVVGVARVPRAVGGDANHGPEQDDPVEQVHANQREKSVSSATTSTKTMKTKR